MEKLKVSGEELNLTGLDVYCDKYTQFAYVTNDISVWLWRHTDIIPVVHKNIWRPNHIGRQANTLDTTIFSHIPGQFVICPELQWYSVKHYNSTWCLWYYNVLQNVLQIYIHVFLSYLIINQWKHCRFYVWFLWFHFHVDVSGVEK